MGEAFILRRGGAAARALGAYALICVSLPSGSACVCAKGGERYAVEDAPGLAAFAVTGSGTWTVTISDGARSKSRDAAISAAGEIKTLRLSYGEDVLFSPQGGLAQGYSVGGNAGVSGGAIVETGDGGFWLSPAVDLSDYESVTLTGVLRSAGTYNSRISVGSTAEKAYSLLQTAEVNAEWVRSSLGTEHSVTLDVSALQGAYYIGSKSLGNCLEITEIVLSEGGGAA